MPANLWWWKARKCWAVKYVDPVTGRRKNLQLGPDRPEADRLYHVRMADLLSPAANDAPPGNDTRIVLSRLTLADLASRYLQWNRENLAPRTAHSRAVYLAWLVEPYGFEQADAVTPQHVEAVKRAHRGNAPKSVNHFVTAVKGLYRWGMDQGLVDANPVARVKGVPKAPVRRLAVSLLQAVRAYRAADASPPLGDYMRLLLFTGMRSGELAGLRWDAYDARSRVLIVAEHKTAGRTGEPRILPLSDRAAEVVERQPRGTDAIFSTGAGRALSRDALAQRWKRVRPAGCPVSFHVLRHTFVSRLLARGVPEWEVQRLVGHSSTLMTRYYASADMRRLRDAVGRL